MRDRAAPSAGRRPRARRTGSGSRRSRARSSRRWSAWCGLWKMLNDRLRLARATCSASCHRRRLPAALVLLLVFPRGGIAGARLGLDVVPPHVLGALAVGPDVLAGDAAGVAADALVEVEHHRDLRADVHIDLLHSAYHLRSGSLRTSTSVSRLHAGRPPVVEVVGELPVAADHQDRLQADAGEAVVAARAPVAAQRRLRHAERCAPARGRGCRCRAGCAR